MRPTQVYKWNWNRKRARFNIEDGTAKRIKYNVFKMIRNASLVDSQQKLNSNEPNFNKKKEDKRDADEILIFKVERKAARPNGIKKWANTDFAIFQMITIYF